MEVDSEFLDNFALGKHILKRTDLSNTEKLCALTLAITFRSAYTGQCNPGRSAIAKAMGYKDTKGSRGNIKRCIRKLQEKRVLAKVLGGGGKITNSYIFLYDLDRLIALYNDNQGPCEFFDDETIEFLERIIA